MSRTLFRRFILVWGISMVTSAAQAQWPVSALSEDALSVVVLGQATAAPDQVLITVELTVAAASYREGFQQINDQVEILRGVLEKAEVPADAIAVKSPIFVSPTGFLVPGAPGLPEQGMMFQPPAPPAGDAGQRQAKASVTAVLPVSQEDLEGSLGRLDEVLQALTEAGYAAPKVAFSLKDPAALEGALMQDALAKAKARAVSLGAALGVQVGPVKSAQTMDLSEIMESYMQGLFGGLGNLMQMVGGILGGGEPVNPREVTLRRMVVVNFKL